MRREIVLNNGNLGIEENGKLYEVIVLKNGLGESKEKHIVEVESDEWYHLKCIEIPQRIAVRQKVKGTNRHFEATDLESFLTFEAYNIWLKYDKEKHLYFEAWLRKTLALKTISFFRDTEIDKITDYAIQSGNDGEDDSEVDVLSSIADEDIWAEVESDQELEAILSDLDDDERYVAVGLLKGFNSSEIARELGTYREKTRRLVRNIVKKANLKQKEDRYTTRNHHLKSCTNEVTKDRVKNYEKYIKRLNENNKDLHQTVIDWAKELAQYQE